MANRKVKQRDAYRVSVSFAVDCNREDLKSVCEAMLSPDYVQAEPVGNKPANMTLAEYVIDMGEAIAVTDTSGREDQTGIVNLRTLLHGVARLLQENKMAQFNDELITRRDAAMILSYAIGTAP